jgi:hypothetical protein
MPRSSLPGFGVPCSTQIIDFLFDKYNRIGKKSMAGKVWGQIYLASCSSRRTAKFAFRSGWYEYAEFFTCNFVSGLDYGKNNNIIKI